MATIHIAQAIPDDDPMRQQPGLTDVAIAQMAVRVHCPIDWPEGLRCNNCQAPFPCAVRAWGIAVLVASGRTEAEIAALDARTGPWS